MEVGPGVCSAQVGLCHSWETPNLGNPHSYKGTTSKQVQPLPQRETLSLLYWWENKFAFCLRGSQYLYLPRMFALKKKKKKKAQNESCYELLQKSERTMEIPSPQERPNPILTSTKNGVISFFVHLILLSWRKFHGLLSSGIPFDSQKWVWKSKKCLLAIFITAVTIPLHFKLMEIPSDSPGDKSLTGKYRTGKWKDYNFKLHCYILTCKRTLVSQRCFIAEKLSLHLLLPAPYPLQHESVFSQLLSPYSRPSTTNQLV